MPVREELRILLEKQLQGQLTATERSRFLYLLRQPQNKLLLEDNLEDILHQHRYHDTTNLDKQALFEQVLQAATDADTTTTATPVVPLHAKMRKWLPYAAAILIILVAATRYFMQPTKSIESLVATNTTASSPLPDTTNKVLLTLADGTQVAIDEVRDGNIDNKLGAHIKKQQGVIVFNPSTTTANTKETYNTITTTRGKQYHIVLPDKTEVWLNAASSLKFPLEFNGKERKVELTGEGYFEVTKNPRQPFIVTANEQTVKVLGTHFNIMAYTNEEAIRTTLLEGSVKVGKGQRAKGKGQRTEGKEEFVILKPGEQAILSHSSQTSHPISVQTPNLEQIMAWKNGEFRFEDTGIETIMRQVERWYDLDVVYKGTLPSDLGLSGVIARTEKVTQLLDILETTHKVHFNLEGNKLVVMPYQTK